MTDLLLYFFSQKKLLLILFLVIFAGITVATLWPFDFLPSNGVNWIPDRNGIHFSRPGVLISTGPLLAPWPNDNSASIELWVRSDEIWFSRTIVALYDPSHSNRLLIRQWNGGLLISRDFSRNPDSASPQRIYVKHIFQRGVPVFLTITSSMAGTTIYVNAVQKQFFANFQIQAGNLSGQLILGISPVDFSPWRGDLYFFSLCASALSPEEVRLRYDSISASNFTPSPGEATPLAQYSFSESSGSIAHSSAASAPDLQIPRKFSIPDKPVLQPPLARYETTWAYYRDAIANVIGFVPFGLILCAYLGNTRFARFAIPYSFLSGALFSFLIEVAQAYVPQRDSGFNDVITNSLGALLGALLAHRLQRR